MFIKCLCVYVEWSGQVAREQKLDVSCCQSLYSAARDRKRDENAYEVENESRIIDQVDDNRA